MILSFDEIKDGQQFEDLVVAYFENLNIEELAITEISVEPSAKIQKVFCLLTS
jgi:hypothetical protein